MCRVSVVVGIGKCELRQESFFSIQDRMEYKITNIPQQQKSPNGRHIVVRNSFCRSYLTELSNFGCIVLSHAATGLPSVRGGRCDGGGHGVKASTMGWVLWSVQEKSRRGASKQVEHPCRKYN